MKKVLIIISIFFMSIFSYFFIYNVFADCSYNSWDLKSSFDNCYSDTKLIKADNLKLTEGWFKSKIINFIDGLSFYIWIAAVFWIVFSAFRLTISTWKDEAIGNAKKNFLWVILWFSALIFSSTIIIVLIKFFYII